MKKIILIFVLNFFCTLFLYAQLNKTIPELTPPNPEAASLGTYGEVPIDLYTGTANIVVPLYSYNFEGLNIPINISYNTGGVRSSQEASWVGLGWRLSSEPIITVQTKGLADLIYGNYSGPIKIGFPYTNVPIQEYGGGYNAGTPELIDKLNLYVRRDLQFEGWDTEPDIFTVNIFGETASFILTQKALNNGKIGVQSINGDKRFKIEFIESDVSFVITNDAGFKFYFDKKEQSATVSSSNDTSYSISAVHNYSTITSWKLTKITSPTNKDLTFSYYEMVTTQSQIQHFESQKTGLYCPNTNVIPPALLSPPHGTSNIINGFEVFYLKEIKSDNISILFNTSQRSDIFWIGDPQAQVAFWGNASGYTDNRPKKLDEIIIRNLSGNIINKYNFSYTYFNQNFLNDSKSKQNLRLKLDSITFNNEFYRGFSYINPNSLSNKERRTDDYWGFYNGIDNTYNNFPSYKKDKVRCVQGDYTNIFIEGGNRLPNFQYGKNGILEKVIYPTKGYTKLTYEPHSVHINKNNRITEHPFEQYDDFSIVSMYDHIPATSNIFHLRHDITQEGFSSYAPTLKIASGFNSFDSSSQSHYLQYIPDWQSIQKPALEMINAQTNQVVRKYIFSDDPTCPNTGQFGCPQLTLPANSNTKTLNLSFTDIPEGDYYFRATALHEPGNVYDEDEGCYSCSDYGKQYQFSVKFELKVPKSFKEEGYNREIGGARIKTIENYDSDNQILSKKEYNYVLGDESLSLYQGMSSGVLMDKLVFANSINSGTDYFNVTPTVTIGESESFSESILHSPSDNYIGYSRVEEKTIDTQNQNKGKKVSIFYNRPNSYNTVMNLSGNFILWNDPNVSNGYSTLEMASFPEYSSYDINGTASREEFFDSNSNKIKEISYDYNHDYSNVPLIARDDIIGKGLIQKFHNFYSFDEFYKFYKYTDGTLSHLQIYKILNKSIPLIRKTTKEYFNGIPLTTNVTYEYNDQYLLKVASVESSSGGVNEVNNSYAHEKGNQYLIDKNMVGIPLQTITTKTANGVTKTLSDVETKYPTSQAEADTKTAGLPLPYEVESKTLDGSSINKELTYDKYDEKGNILQYSEKGLKPTVIIWGYNQTQPIAKIEGAKYDDIKTIQVVLDAIIASDTDATQGTATSEQSLLTALDNLRINSSLSGYVITTYTYDPLIGVTSITPPSGIREIYKYDTANRLQSVVDINGKILKEYQYNYKQ